MNGARFWEAYGIIRSLMIYYRPLRIRSLRHFYDSFIQAGDLCFDIGAHAGNRVRAWRTLGAKVIAVEPQPAFMRLLQRWYGQDENVVLIEEAVGGESGSQTMYISRRTPTLTTLSSAWATAVQQDKSFQGVSWDEEISVQVTTLDALIARFGMPGFCKIDVEGYEFEVLRGLNHPIPQLSFEVIPATRELAFSCVERLHDLGHYEFAFSPGESLTMQWPGWYERDAILQWLEQLSDDAPSGDIYARLVQQAGKTSP